MPDTKWHEQQQGSDIHQPLPTVINYTMYMYIVYHPISTNKLGFIVIISVASHGLPHLNIAKMIQNSKR